MGPNFAMDSGSGTAISWTSPFDRLGGDTDAAQGRHHECPQLTPDLELLTGEVRATIRRFTVSTSMLSTPISCGSSAAARPGCLLATRLMRRLTAPDSRG